jgi:maltose alpha-D-glucosyltransferase/alpha-amylase
MEHMLRIRKECPEFGWGSFTVLNTRHASVLAHRCEWKDGAVIAVHNLAKAKLTVHLDLSQGERLFELLGDRRHEVVDDPHTIELPGYGYRWFRVGGKHWKQP